MTAFLEDSILAYRKCAAFLKNLTHKSGLSKNYGFFEKYSSLIYLGPFHKPEEFLQRTMDNLAHEDWETNVNGMAAVLRFARHHPDYLLVEYKPLLQHVMKHVKNLRSQVIIITGYQV